MGSLRYLTAGESHGSELTAIIEGMPAGLSLSCDVINHELARRQQGYGRGSRMAIENDTVTLSSGIRFGVTTGAPITLHIKNRDHSKWQEIMATEPIQKTLVGRRRVHHPRPGHADLVGGIKYGYTDLRDSLERASARETAIRVAIGAICMQALDQLGIRLFSHVRQFGSIQIIQDETLAFDEKYKRARQSDISVIVSDQEEAVKTLIDATKEAGDTLGGHLEVVVTGVPAGLGSFVHWDRKLDAKLAQAILSINAIKGVSFGDGFELGTQPGSRVMDSISWDETKGYHRTSNHLGGFEGGVTTGEELCIQAVMKPIPTLYKPLETVDTDTKWPHLAAIERSDVTALPAAGVVMEAVVATTLLSEIVDTCWSDTMSSLLASLEHMRKKAYNFSTKQERG